LHKLSYAVGTAARTETQRLVNTGRRNTGTGRELDNKKVKLSL
jgi:hypothetical protein